MQKIKAELMDKLSAHERITINTPNEHSAPHIINFTAQGIKGEVFVHALEEKECLYQLHLPAHQNEKAK